MYLFIEHICAKPLFNLSVFLFFLLVIDLIISLT